MAYFDKKPADKSKGKSDPTNPFAFDIDEVGHSTESRQRIKTHKDTSIINLGQHCSLSICGQLDVLPCTCDYCGAILCRVHIHPEQHDCSEYMADLTTSPQCVRCHQFIRMDPKVVTNRTTYNSIVSQHVESGCTRHTFKRSAEELASIKAQLRCAAPSCNNITGKKLSTIICPDCHQQVCLSHRSPDFHACPRLLEEQAREKKAEEKKKAEREELLKKMYGDLSQPSSASTTNGTSNNTTRPNSTTERLRQAQLEVRTRALANCKNPYLINKLTASASASSDAPSPQGPDVSTASKTATTATTDDGDDAVLVPVSRAVTTIPTRGTMITHSQSNPLNTKTALMLAKSKAKNPANTTIKPPTAKVYAIVYFPQSIIPTSQLVSPDPEVPFSTQDNMLTFNQSPFHHVIELFHAENPGATLQHSTTLLPQITGDPNPLTSPTSLKSFQLLQSNTKMASPLYVALDKSWTIKQCIDEICKCIGLVSYDALSRTSSGKVVYTLSPLAFPIAVFNQSVALETVVGQLQLDFDLETEMEQEGVFDQLRQFNNSNNNNSTTTTTMGDHDTPHHDTATDSSTTTSPAMTTSPTRQAAALQHKTKSANHRINTTLLPLHLAFGWYLDSQ